jgi:hypothetical protein
MLLDIDPVFVGTNNVSLAKAKQQLLNIENQIIN